MLADMVKSKVLRTLVACSVLSVVLSLLLRTRGGLSAGSPLSDADVHKAQRAWGQGIVAIGKAMSTGGHRARAAEHLDDLYAYGRAPVLFKPTKAAVRQFRGDREAALSYFVGGNPSFPEDKGFALQPWTAVRFDNTGISTAGDTAVAMGNYFFTDTSGAETKVEYTFGYLRTADGNVRINVHHSSLPYSGKAAAGVTKEEVLEAQRRWGDGIVAIGERISAGDHAARAAEHIDSLYAFGRAPVLFKPTKAARKQFRSDRTAALSYFVGGNADFPEDKGFAMAPWRAVRFENAGGIHIMDGAALAMGNYYFTDTCNAGPPTLGASVLAAAVPRPRSSTRSVTSR
eukprot:TRINITY_DN15410_c0_g1_i2.p1 TRINITY_DN15410_c0_g1~~TRINITY_DN15410_c0_g1_i2.p1  ORF type:complete len:344 (+),score=96.72 TRINITY_DN15410_c0_g1_i2:99-1130(+)